MRDSEFPNRPNAYDFINWLYCPECGSKGQFGGHGADFTLHCYECGNEKEVHLGVTPPFDKTTPDNVSDTIAREMDRGPLPYQKVNVHKRLREMDDEQVKRELEKAGYHSLAEKL